MRKLMRQVHDRKYTMFSSHDNIAQVKEEEVNTLGTRMETSL